MSAFAARARLLQGNVVLAVFVGGFGRRSVTSARGFWFLGGWCLPSQLKRLLQGGRGVEPDLAYINSLSLWLDIKNLTKPPFTLLPKDIY